MAAMADPAWSWPPCPAAPVETRPDGSAGGSFSGVSGADGSAGDSSSRVSGADGSAGDSSSRVSEPAVRASFWVELPLCDVSLISSHVLRGLLTHG